MRSKTGVPFFKPDPVISALIVGTVGRTLLGRRLKLNFSDCSGLSSRKAAEPCREKNSLSIIFPSLFLFLILNRVSAC